MQISIFVKYYEERYGIRKNVKSVVKDPPMCRDLAMYHEQQNVDSAVYLTPLSHNNKFFKIGTYLPSVSYTAE